MLHPLSALHELNRILSGFSLTAGKFSRQVLMHFTVAEGLLLNGRDILKKMRQFRFVQVSVGPHSAA